jgi:3-dehydroquinate dehydratase-1
MKQKKKPHPFGEPMIVATVHTAKGVREAISCKDPAFDLFEIRLDCLGQSLNDFSGAAEKFSKPLLITARHPNEGGFGNLSTAQRRLLLRLYLPAAAAVDVELRSVELMRDLLLDASHHGVVKVISYHNFRTTPSLPNLQKIVRHARREGADIPKVATQLRTPSDLVTLLRLQMTMGGNKGPLAVMGMGPLGKVSRLMLASAGSRLNYGYFDRPQVQGQWSAATLSARLKECLS